MLFVGRNLRSRLDILKPDIRRHVHNKQMDQTASHKSAKGMREFQIGQTVSVRDYRGQQKWIPGVIHARTGPLSYEVCVGPNMIWRGHIDQLLDSDTGKPPVLTEPVPYDIIPPIIQPEVHQPTSTPAPAVPSETTSSTKSTVSDSPHVVERRYPAREHKPPDKLNL